MIADAQTIEIRSARWGLLKPLAAGLALTGLSIAFAWPIDPSIRPGSAAQWVGIASAAVFGAVTLIGIVRQAMRLVQPDDVVLTLSPSGLHDPRVAREVIPWPAILRIGSWRYSGARLLVLDVAPEVEAGLGLTPSARRNRAPNRLAGIDGLAISTAGLQLPHDEIHALATSFRKRFGAE